MSIEFPKSWKAVDGDLGSVSRGPVAEVETGGTQSGVYTIRAENYNGVHCFGVGPAGVFVLSGRLDGKVGYELLLEGRSLRTSSTLHAMSHYIKEMGGRELPAEVLGGVKTTHIDRTTGKICQHDGGTRGGVCDLCGKVL